MPDNLPDDDAGWRGLPGHRVLALTGRDALAFAQAQFMGDVAALADGQWQWNGWLTPKGRVVALFAVLRLDAGTLWLLLPDADPEALAAQLRRFVFRSKVTAEARPGLAVSGAFRAPAAAAGNAFAGTAETGFELDMSGDTARVLRIGPAGDTVANAGFADRWKLADLRHGLPRLDATQSGEWTPQMLSLQRLNAFSVKKGCYPGQEIVARTHFLGQSKRGLALLESDLPLTTGRDVVAAGRAIGKVVGIASAGDRHLALAVLPLARDDTPLQVDGATARELPLLDGLAR